MKQPKGYSINEMKKDGESLKFMRKKMKMTQTEFCKKSGINQANYCRMEKGLSYGGKAMFFMIQLFCAWRKKEILRLESLIIDLKSFSIQVK